MKIIDVKSSMIAALAYDESIQTLRVKFNSGDLYEYYEVEPETFRELLEADSKGQYMRACIIDCYEYAKI